MKDNEYIWDTLDLDEEDIIEEDTGFKQFEEYEDDDTVDIVKPKKIKKHSFKFYLVVFLLVGIIVFFIPFFKVDKIDIKQNDFVDGNLLIENSGIKVGDSLNFLDLFRLKNKFMMDGIIDNDVIYDKENKSINVYLTEIKPLAVLSDKNLYYSDHKDILFSNEMVFDVPKLIGFNFDQEKEVVEILNGLEYNIIKEIAVIKNQSTEAEKNLVIMEMKDGNFVKINLSQVAVKMPYYNQMGQIIRQIHPGSRGIIHLNRGNYYERL